jgi:hypothetical protein
MENALRACCKGIKIGKILIHREGDNGKQVLVVRLCWPFCWMFHALWYLLVQFYPDAALKTCSSPNEG